MIYWCYYYLPESSVTISITHPKLVPLLGEHDLVDLGEYPRLSDSGNLETMLKLNARIEHREELTCDV